MDKETLALIIGLASLAVGLVGVAATLFVQERRREQKARAETGGVAVAGDQHVGGSIVTGSGAVVADRGGTALNVIAQPGATVNVYLDGLPQAGPQVRDHFEQGLRLAAAEQHEAAIREFERAFAAAENDSQRCALHNLIGRSFFCLGRPSEAESHFRQALEAAKRGGDRQGEAAALGNLGIVSLERGKLGDAQNFHERALAIEEEIGNNPDQAATLGNLGLVYADRGELAKAKEHYHKALAIHQRLGNRLGEASQLANLGNVHADRGDLDKAEEYHSKALAIHEEIGNKLGQANQLGNLGNVYAERGDLDNAEEHCRRALAIDGEIGNRLGQADALAMLGQLAGERGHVDKARGLLAQAKALYDAMGAGGQGPDIVRPALERLAGAVGQQPPDKPARRKAPRKKP
jgi:tetratricopeptide (TPR) repeat protein